MPAWCMTSSSTENHLLFPILPHHRQHGARDARPAALRLGAGKGAYVGVMKRNGSAKDIVWFRAESCYVFHVMNAWEEGDRIIADVMQFEEAPLFTHPDGSPTDPKKSNARLCRWTFDLAGNTDRFTQTYLDDMTGEFPRIDDRRAGLTNSTWLVRLRQSTICRCSARSPASSMSTARDQSSANICCLPATPSPRPVFVERGKDAAEGDGWLLAAVWRARENRSDLAVFNATDVEAGPVALVQLAIACPTGFTATGWGRQ